MTRAGRASPTRNPTRTSSTSIIRGTLVLLVVIAVVPLSAKASWYSRPRGPHLHIFRYRRLPLPSPRCQGGSRRAWREISKISKPTVPVVLAVGRGRVRVLKVNPTARHFHRLDALPLESGVARAECITSSRHGGRACLESRVIAFVVVPSDLGIERPF